MVGKVPVLLEIDVQPMAWFDFETMASFNANMQLSGEMQYKQSFTVDIDDGEFSSSESPLNGEDAVPSIDNLSVSGDFSANADVRVGPRINFSVYKVPVSLDIAAKVGVSTELKGSVDHSGKACATGSAQLTAGLDARLGMTVPLLDPVAFAKDACEEAARTMIEFANPANHMIDRAQCFTDILDIDTSAIDDAQEDMNEAMTNLADEICNGAIDFLVPESLQELSAAGSSFGSGNWNNIISVEAGVEKGLCGNVELNKPGSSPGGLAPAPTPSTSSNLALGKPTTLTNTSHGAHGSRAVDGNTNGHWSQGSTTHTHQSTNPSWSVDLQSTFTIDTVKVYNRQDSHADRLSGFKLIIWKGAQQAWTYTQSGGTPSHLTTIKVPMIDGDTVEITLPGSKKILSLAEVEVFGIEASRGPARSTPSAPYSKQFMIINPKTGKALDVSGRKCHDKNNIQLWDRTGSPAQIFHYHYETKAIVNVLCDKSLDIGGGSCDNGTNIQLYKRHGGLNQQFVFEESDAGTVRNEKCNRVIDIAGGENKNGANLHIWDAHGRWNQKWEIEYV